MREILYERLSLGEFDGKFRGSIKHENWGGMASTAWSGDLDHEVRVSSVKDSSSAVLHMR
jgi:hypothetical protein